MSEWSNWIEHDGKSCPVEGQYVQVQSKNGSFWEGIAGADCKKYGINVQTGPGSAWIWSPQPELAEYEIKLYRIRKPKGVQVLDEIMQFFSIDKKITEDA